MKSTHASLPAAALRVLAGIVLLLFGLPAHAAAANDHFAASALLAPALPVQVTATNAKASVEAGEPQPESAQATLWWRWTPLASGWVRVFTEGTGIDTVLGMYRGETLAGLNLLAFNDDHGNSEEHTGESELVVFVDAGTTYRIQAGGYENWQGAFALRVEAIASGMNGSCAISGYASASKPASSAKMAVSIASFHVLRGAKSSKRISGPDVRSRA